MATPWVVTPAAGDIAKEAGLRVETVTFVEDATKGQVITIATGEVADDADAEVGPFGVVLADVAYETEPLGQVAIAPSVVYLEAGAAGFTAMTPVKVSNVGTNAEDGMVVDKEAADVYDEIVGLALETKTDGLIGMVQLGYA